MGPVYCMFDVQLAHGDYISVSSLRVPLALVWYQGTDSFTQMMIHAPGVPHCRTDIRTGSYWLK